MTVTPHPSRPADVAAEPARSGSKVATDALRQSAETLSQRLPALLVEAERVAATVAAGVHGRRRTGMGETFWQFRQYQPGDATAASTGASPPSRASSSCASRSGRRPRASGSGATCRAR